MVFAASPRTWCRQRPAWATVELAAGRQPPWIGPDDERRIRKRLNRLAHDAEPEQLLRSWMAARADLHAMSSTDAPTLRNDSRVVASGVNDPRSGMAASPREFEGYVHVDEFDQLCRDHLLVPALRHRANVLLRAAPVRPAAPVPLLVLAADLADRDGPRENERARILIDSALVRRDTDRWSRLVSVLMPAMSGPQQRSWMALLDLHEVRPTGWTLVGGQMVHLHCAERGASSASGPAPLAPVCEKAAVTPVRVRAERTRTRESRAFALQRRPTVLHTRTTTTTRLGAATF